MNRFLVASITAVAIVLSAGAYAQQLEEDLQKIEVTPEQLELGEQLLELSGSSRAFDEVLPNVADKVKTAMIRSNPQMQLGIIEMVDKVALEMVNKRAELDQALARLWAGGFSEEELNELIAFYKTDTGKKFAQLQPSIIAGQVALAERWGNRVAGEINKRVIEEIKAVNAAEARNLLGAAPAEEAAPQAQPGQ